ncbi:MAG: hypothetical protein ACREQH_10170 [Candidatus Binatus sp.]
MSKLFDKLADVGEFFAGPDKIDLTGQLARTEEGAWTLLLQSPMKLRNSTIDRIELDHPKTEISEGLEGHLVSIRGRVATKGIQGNLVFEPDEVTPTAVASPASATN